MQNFNSVQAYSIYILHIALSLMQLYLIPAAYISEYTEYTVAKIPEFNLSAFVTDGFMQIFLQLLEPIVQNIQLSFIYTRCLNICLYFEIEVQPRKQSLFTATYSNSQKNTIYKKTFAIMD